MEAKELRIGNYVYRENGKLINQKTDVYQVENVNLQSAFKYDPIPLTEEWLLKFGFDNNHFNKECFYRKYNVQGDFFIFSNKTPVAISNNIKSPFYYMFGGLAQSLNTVHQLQNLYFALTKEELTIK